MRHALLAMVFGVLLARALLSSIVMIDPDHDAGGAVLMLCSGHGVMLVTPSMHDDDAMHAMPGMDMSDTSDMATPMGHAHSDAGVMSHSGDLCAFSAALATALAGIVILVFLFAPLRLRASWRLPRSAPIRALLLHFRPPTRAPPLFA
jgi:hypothetical protein